MVRCFTLAWRGTDPALVVGGDAETGVTIMKMDVGLDTGDIQLACPITADDTVPRYDNWRTWVHKDSSKPCSLLILRLP